MSKKNLHAKRINVKYHTNFDILLMDMAHLLPFALLVIILPLAYFSYLAINLFLMTILSGLMVIAWKESRRLKYPHPSYKERIGLVNYPEQTFFLHFGDAVTDMDAVIDPPLVRNPYSKYKDKKGVTRKRPAKIGAINDGGDGFNPEAVRYPILFSQTQVLTHMFVTGTTGSGKTTFVVNILEQIMGAGGGSLVIDGKGDQSIYEAFYNTAVRTRREDDMLIINFQNPEESHTLNPLLRGSADDITDIIGQLLETEGENGFWAGRGLQYMKGLLSILVPLRDAGALFDPDGNHVRILTFSLINRWQDVPSLRMLFFTMLESNKIGRLVDRMVGAPATAGEISIKVPDDAKERFSTVVVDRLRNYLGTIAVNLYDPNAKIDERSESQHGNSVLMWGESLDLISMRFASIFNTDNPEVDMTDVVVNSRCVYVLLPSLKLDPRALQNIGRMILSFFKQAVSALLGEKVSGSVEDRYKSFATRPRVPFWGGLDEYGSYAVEGFDNVLAQARSLRVMMSIFVQETASLEKNGEVEKKRLLGNTALKVVLKLEEDKTIKEAQEWIGKHEVAKLQRRSMTTESKDMDIRIEQEERLNVEDLKKLKGGHAWVIWGGQPVPALVRFYEPPVSRIIPEFDLFRATTKGEWLAEDFSKEIRDYSLNPLYDSLESKIERFANDTNIYLSIPTENDFSVLENESNIEERLKKVDELIEKALRIKEDVTPID